MTKEFLSEYESDPPIVNGRTIDCDRTDCRILKGEKFAPINQTEVYDKHGNVINENCSRIGMQCLVCGRKWIRMES